jgi:hypothetical protein
VPIRSAEQREVGFDRDVLVVPDDFDRPLPRDLLEGFER